jgi:hypothetical protein
VSLFSLLDEEESKAKKVAPKYTVTTTGSSVLHQAVHKACFRFMYNDDGDFEEEEKRSAAVATGKPSSEKEDQCTEPGCTLGFDSKTMPAAVAVHVESAPLMPPPAGDTPNDTHSPAAESMRNPADLEAAKQKARRRCAFNCALVKYLCSVQDMKVDQRDDSGQTPLHHAVRNGHCEEVVRILLEAGHSMNVQVRLYVCVCSPSPSHPPSH